MKEKYTKDTGKKIKAIYDPKKFDLEIDPYKSVDQIMKMMNDFFDVSEREIMVIRFCTFFQFQCIELYSRNVPLFVWNEVDKEACDIQEMYKYFANALKVIDLKAKHEFTLL